MQLIKGHIIINDILSNRTNSCEGILYIIYGKIVNDRRQPKTVMLTVAGSIH